MIVLCAPLLVWDRGESGALRGGSRHAGIVHIVSLVQRSWLCMGWSTVLHSLPASFDHFVMCSPAHVHLSGHGAFQHQRIVLPVA